MENTNALKQILRIAKYTIADEVRQKSFIIMFIVSGLIVFMMRSCYQGQYTVNGQMMDLSKTASTVSVWIFHAITTLSSIIAALLAMRVFSREKSDGMLTAIMSKPVKRPWYVAGKIIGLWILSMLFMFTLHGIVFVVTSVNMKVVVEGYVFASMLSTFNLLFIIIAVLFFTLIMPDMMAFLAATGIGVASSATDWVYSMYAGGRELMDAMMLQQGASMPEGHTWGKIICYIWPKLSGLNKIAASLIGSTFEFKGFISVYPVVNLLVYCLIFGALLLWRFNKEDLA
jgi:ABC-type transport system involved in multi-copper enzyme maturation permease subunit